MESLKSRLAITRGKIQEELDAQQMAQQQHDEAVAGLSEPQRAEQTHELNKQLRLFMAESAERVVEYRAEEQQLLAEISLRIRTMATDVQMAQQAYVSESMEEQRRADQLLQQISQQPAPTLIEITEETPPEDFAVLVVENKQLQQALDNLRPESLSCGAAKLEYQHIIKQQQARMAKTQRELKHQQHLAQTLTNEQRETAQAKIAALQQELNHAKVTIERFKLDLQAMRELSEDSAKAHDQVRQLRKQTSNQHEAIERMARQTRALQTQLKELSRDHLRLQQQYDFARGAHQERDELREALKRCQHSGLRVNDELQKVTRAARDLHQQNQHNLRKVHAMSIFMAEAAQQQQRLREEHKKHLQVEQELRAASQTASTAQSRLRALEDLHAASVMEHKHFMGQCQQRVAQLSKGAPPPPQKSVTVSPITVLRDCHEKESDVMRDRLRMLQELAAQIEAFNPEEAGNMVDRLQEIRERGAARERQHMEDLFELQQVLLRLKQDASQQNTVERMQTAKKNMAKMTAYASSSSRDFEAQAEIYDKLNRARQQQLTERLEWQAQVERANQSYRDDLQRILSQKQQIDELIQNKRLPNYEKYRHELDDMANQTMASLERQNVEAVANARQTQNINTELQTLIAEQRKLLSSVDDFLRQNSPEARAELVDLANKSVQELVRRRQLAAGLRDQRVRWNIILGPVLRPRTAREVAERLEAEKGLRVDQDLNMVQIMVGGKPAEQLPVNKFFPDSLSLFEPLTDLTRPRVDQAFVQKRDLIVVSYALKAAGESAISTRKMVFTEAIKHIQARLGGVSLEMQLVKIDSTGKRMDALQNNADLPTNCNFETCGAKIEAIHDLFKLPQMVSDKVGEENMVLSFTVHERGSEQPARIHVVDVLVNDVKTASLVDQSWTDYLLPTIQNANANIDLFFTVIPSNELSETDKNNQLLDYSYRISTFLSAFKAASGKA